MNPAQFTRHRASLLAMIAAAPLFSGAVCRSRDDQVCILLLAGPSVVLDIRDAQGRTLQNATVVYNRNFDALVAVSCDADCNALTLAHVRTGHFVFRVTAGGYVAQTGSAFVFLDETGCNPDTQFRTIVLQRDDTAGVLFGAWTYTNADGQTTIIRFDEAGAPIGALLTNRLNTGDGNIYIRFNDRTIAGAPGQMTQPSPAQFAARFGTLVNWSVLFGGIPIGFENATLAADFNSLTGTLVGSSVTYTRLPEIPPALRDPA